MSDQLEETQKQLVMERAIAAIGKRAKAPLKVAVDSRLMMLERPLTLAQIRERGHSHLDFETGVNRHEWQGHEIPGGCSVVREEMAGVAAMFADGTIDSFRSRATGIGRWKGVPIATLFRDRGDVCCLAIAMETRNSVVSERTRNGTVYVLRRYVEMTLYLNDGSVKPADVLREAQPINYAYDYNDESDRIDDPDRSPALA